MQFPFSSSKTKQEKHDEPENGLSRQQIKRATRTRKIFTLLTAFFLLITVIFLILVEIAGTRRGDVSTDWYFLQLDLSDVVPTSVPNAQLLNTIARTLGLHDFYQVYLWNFCEGYEGEGVTNCSSPEALWWFNPVEILSGELLAGASIQLPAEINDVLDIVRVASRWMFGLFLTGACLSFVLIFLVFIPIYTRWLSLLMSILTLLNALFVTAASIIATVMFIIVRDTVGGVEQLNIRANIGDRMFGFMWTAAAFAILTFIVHVWLCCCCASRRDVRSGRKRGSEKAYLTNQTEGVKFESEKRPVAWKQFWKRSN